MQQSHAQMVEIGSGLLFIFILGLNLCLNYLFATFYGLHCELPPEFRTVTEATI